MSKAKQYKVKALSLGGLNGKVFNSGDMVTQDQLAATVEDLMKAGFLVDENAKDEKSDKEEEELLRLVEEDEKKKKK